MRDKLTKFYTVKVNEFSKNIIVFYIQNLRALKNCKIFSLNCTPGKIEFKKETRQK